VAEHVTRRHQQLKRILVEEAGGCCVLCGYDRCIVALQFHHVDPGLKAFPMSTASGKALDTYREEMRKCVLVCANCHCEIETGTTSCPPAGTRFEEWTLHYSYYLPAQSPEDAIDELGEDQQLSL
jgi:hypothetical protein